MTKRSRRAATDLDKVVGARLRHFRELRGMSQEDLATAPGVRLTFGQVQKFEYGSNRIAVSRLIPLLKALDVTVGEFFDGIVDGKPTPTLSGHERRNVIQLVRDYESIPDEQTKTFARSSIRTLAALARNGA